MPYVNYILKLKIIKKMLNIKNKTMGLTGPKHVVNQIIKSMT
jgi:hypothetical protein